MISNGYRTSKPRIVAKAEAAIDAEEAACTQCAAYAASGFGPPHTKAIVYRGVDGNKVLSVGGCESGSRKFDLTTETLVGRAHCTCDGCF